MVMGILNTTPDSFSDGGAHVEPDAATAAGRSMWETGAGIIDVGGESTRPGSEPIPLGEELDRVLPVVAALAAEGIPVSIDTSKPAVARAAIEAGALVVNDVTGLTNQAMVDVVASTGVGVVIMHMLGTPRTMQDDPTYDDVVDDVSRFLLDRADFAEQRGVDHASIVIDPGIGFGKTLRHNLDLLAATDRMARLGYPLLIGTSRKGFLGELLTPVRGKVPPGQRDMATLGTVALAVAKGARIVRVHNVAAAVEVATTVDAIVRHDGRDELI
jgi:dihydropteroate synthase